MKALALVSVLLATQMRGFAADLSLTAQLWQPMRSSDKALQAFFVRAVLKNHSDRTVTFFMMSCSWDDSWKIDSQLDFLVFGWACTKNNPSVWKLEPDESLEFEFWIGPRRGVAEGGERIRLGFAPINQMSLEKAKVDVARYLEAERVWSSELVLPPQSRGEDALKAEHGLRKVPARSKEVSKSSEPKH